MSDNFEFTPRMQGAMRTYIRENFSVGDTYLVNNIIHYVALQDLDLDDTADTLYLLLDGIGFDRQEIKDCLTESNLRYVERGYASRKDWLRHLSIEYRVDYSEVEKLADELDYGALVMALNRRRGGRL